MSCFAVFFIILGSYLEKNNVPTSGISQPSRHGQGGGIDHEFPAWAVIAVGAFFAIVPLKDVLKFIKSKWYRTRYHQDDT